jgi:prepilin-type N-terminal cleavage/methylation domain-containing protein
MSPRRGGFSLIELLCVIVIILILVGLMLGPIFRAYKKARGLGEDSGKIEPGRPLTAALFCFASGCNRLTG